MYQRSNKKFANIAMFKSTEYIITLAFNLVPTLILFPTFCNLSIFKQVKVISCQWFYVLCVLHNFLNTDVILKQARAFIFCYVDFYKTFFFTLILYFYSTRSTFVLRFTRKNRNSFFLSINYH